PDRPTRQRQGYLATACAHKLRAAQQLLTDVRLAPEGAEERTCGEARVVPGHEIVARATQPGAQLPHERASVPKSAVPAELLRLAGGALRDHDVNEGGAAGAHRLVRGRAPGLPG